MQQKLASAGRMYLRQKVNTVIRPIDGAVITKTIKPSRHDARILTATIAIRPDALAVNGFWGQLLPPGMMGVHGFLIAEVLLTGC